MKTAIQSLLCLLFVVSCTVYDLNTAPNEGLINVELSLNIDFGSTTARVVAFDHVFQGAMTVTFSSTTSDYTKSVNFDPNDLDSFPETLLPYDTYSWRVTNDGIGVTISDRLFIYGDSSEDFTVNDATTTISLSLDTDFALVTVDQTNLASVTLAQGSISTPIYKKDGFFYAYLNSNQSGYMLTVETNDGISGSVEITSPIASTRYKVDLSFGSAANVVVGIDEFTTESLELVLDVPVTYPIVSQVSVPVSFNNEITVQNIKILKHENGYFTVRCGMLEGGATFIYDNKTYIVAVDHSTALDYTNDYDDNTCACTSKLTDMSNMFYNTSQPIADITSWDVSNVTNMNGMFGLSNYIPEISHWDVSSVEEMGGMFYGTIFNQDIGDWDVGSVTNLGHMFYENSLFNQDIGGWDVSAAIDLGYMFYRAESFDQAIGSWNVSAAVHMEYMFYGAESFNQAIGGWDVSAVESMTGMFGNTNFNQDLSGWLVDNVIDCSSFQSSMNTVYMPDFRNCSPE